MMPLSSGLLPGRAAGSAWVGSVGCFSDLVPSPLTVADEPTGPSTAAGCSACGTGAAGNAAAMRSLSCGAPPAARYIGISRARLGSADIARRSASAPRPLFAIAATRGNRVSASVAPAAASPSPALRCTGAAPAEPYTCSTSVRFPGLPPASLCPDAVPGLLPASRSLYCLMARLIHAIVDHCTMVRDAAAVFRPAGEKFASSGAARACVRAARL